jgi:hypothetical protein
MENTVGLGIIAAIVILSVREWDKFRTANLPRRKKRTPFPKENT